MIKITIINFISLFMCPVTTLRIQVLTSLCYIKNERKNCPNKIKQL